MPTSRAARTHAWAASSSTCPPWVSQLPYAISEMVRPERPSRLYSTRRDVSPGLVTCSSGHPSRPAPSVRGVGGRVVLSDVGADLDLRLRKAPAPDHGGAADAVPDGALRVLLRQPLGDGALDPPAQQHRVDDEHQEEDHQQEAGIAAQGQVRGDRADDGDAGDHEEEAPDVPPGVDDVADQLLDRALVPPGEIGLVAGGRGRAGGGPARGLVLPHPPVGLLAGGRRRRGRTGTAALGLAALGRRAALAGALDQLLAGLHLGDVLGAVAATGQAQLHDPAVYVGWRTYLGASRGAPYSGKKLRHGGVGPQQDLPLRDPRMWEDRT